MKLDCTPAVLKKRMIKHMEHLNKKDICYSENRIFEPREFSLCYASNEDMTIETSPQNLPSLPSALSGMDNSPSVAPCSPLCGLLRGWVTGLPAKPNTTDFEGFVQSCQNPASQPKHTEPPCTLYGRKKSRIKAGGRKRPPAAHFAQQCWAFFALPHEVVGLRLCHSGGGRNLRKRKQTKEFARSPHRWTPKKGRISHEK